MSGKLVCVFSFFAVFVCLGSGTRRGPHVVVTPARQDVLEGESASVRCSLRNSRGGHYSLDWVTGVSGSNILQKGGTGYVRVSSDGTLLTINNARTASGALYYECIARDSRARVISRARAEITVKEPVKIIESVEVQITIGENELLLVGKKDIVDALPVKYGNDKDFESFAGSKRDRWEIKKLSESGQYVRAEATYKDVLSDRVEWDIFRAEFYDRMRAAGWVLRERSYSKRPVMDEILLEVWEK